MHTKGNKFGLGDQPAQAAGQFSAVHARQIYVQYYNIGRQLNSLTDGFRGVGSLAYYRDRMDGQIGTHAITNYRMVVYQENPDLVLRLGCFRYGFAFTVFGCFPSVANNTWNLHGSEVKTWSSFVCARTAAW